MPQELEWNIKHYFTSDHRLEKKVHKSSSGSCFCASAVYLANVSTWALWCSPPYGRACTGRWKESSPPAEQHTKRQIYCYVHVRYAAFAATCWRYRCSSMSKNLLEMQPIFYLLFPPRPRRKL